CQSEGVFVWCEYRPDDGDGMLRIAVGIIFEHRCIADDRVDPSGQESLHGVLDMLEGTRVEARLPRMVFGHASGLNADGATGRGGYRLDLAGRRQGRQDAGHGRGYVGQDGNAAYQPESLPEPSDPAEQVLACRRLARGRDRHDRVEPFGKAIAPAAREVL